MAPGNEEGSVPGCPIIQLVYPRRTNTMLQKKLVHTHWQENYAYYSSSRAPDNGTEAVWTREPRRVLVRPVGAEALREALQT